MELFRAAKLTDSKGVEFVLFSDVQLLAPIDFGSGAKLVPCFLPLNWKLQSEARQAAMAKRGLFIYDGWVPIDEWTDERLEELVSRLDSFVNLFAVVGKYHAFWEPKCIYSKPPITSQLLYPQDYEALADSQQIINGLPDTDRTALARSLAWMSSAFRNAPIQRFLLLFLSFESLATYIDSSKTKSDSVLKRAFAGEQISRSEKRQQREECIERELAKGGDLTEAIIRAYKNCIDPSIKDRLKEHLKRVFGDEDASIRLFEDKIDGKSLWFLRNDIAHGSLNMLNDAEIRFIERQVGVLEDIVRDYLRRIFSVLAQGDYFPATRLPILTLPASQAIGTPNSQYMGPTDMAEYYLYVEALSSSYTKTTF